MKSLLFAIIFASIILLASSSNIVEAYTTEWKCHDLKLWNGTTVNLSPESYRSLETYFAPVTEYNTYTGQYTNETVILSLCNLTSMLLWYYTYCPPSFVMFTPGMEAMCTSSQAELLNITHRYYPFDAVYFEYRSNSRSAYIYDKTTVVCFCDKTNYNLTVTGNVVTSRAWERADGSYDNTVFVSSQACCAKRVVPPAPPAPHNLTRCKRIFTPDGEGVVPLDNWGALSNYWQSAEEEFGNQNTYESWNVSLCDPTWIWNKNGNFSRVFLNELGGNLRFEKMTRDPYLNQRRQVVFSYSGKSKDGLEATANVNCMCNPSVTNLQLINNRYKVSQVNYRFQIEFDTFSAACCPRPTVDYIAELEQKKQNAVSIFRRLYNFVSSMFF